MTDATVDRINFNLGNLDIRVRHVGLDHVDMKLHGRLCLDGLRLHAWTKEIGIKLVADTCDHYVEPSLLRKEDTRTLNLWAWTKNPSNISKVTWLTITDRGVVVHDGVAAPSLHLRRVLAIATSRSRVIIHLDPSEHFLGRKERSLTQKLIWWAGIIDGERLCATGTAPSPWALQ